MKPQLLITLALPVTIILTNLLALAFTDNTYKVYFKDSEKIHYVLNVISFIRVGTPLDASYFSPQANVHMQDVDKLFECVKIANAIALFALIAPCLYLGHKKKFVQLKKGVILGLILTTLTVLLIFISALLNFNGAFTIFHEIFFRNDDWLFAPSDTLVTLFTLDFFTFFFQKLTTNILATIFALLICVKFFPKNDSKNN